MNDSTSGLYLHGTTRPEQQRLSRLNDFLNEGSLRELSLRGGERILDVGCGLAQFTCAMARTAGPDGCVVGVERSAEQLEQGGERLSELRDAATVDLRQGDAADLPLAEDEWGTFDVAHARFLLEHLPDPLAAVRAMKRAVRPGGRVVLEDDDHESFVLWPDCPGFIPLWRAYVRAFDRLGNDPHIGRRLVALLHEAGCSPTRNAVVFMGGCAGHDTFELVVENLIGVVQGAREPIITGGLLDAAVFDRSIDELRRWMSLPNAAVWYSIAWAEAVRND